jgi:hypothetical protein
VEGDAPGYSLFIIEGRNTQEVLLGSPPGVTGFLMVCWMGVLGP